MADETRIKLIGAGLILATIVVAFLIFSQRFQADKTENLDIPQVVQSSPVATPAASPDTAGVQASVSPMALAQAGQTTKGGQPVQGTLPKTGFPAGLFVILSASAAIAGWGLRKFPH